MTDPFLTHVELTLQRNNLLDGIDVLWIAVSGGADSVALLHALVHVCRPHGPALRVVHVNHGLRGTDSEADAAFVQTLCMSLGVAATLRRVQVPPANRRQGESLEMAARRVRLAAFRAVCAGSAAAALATGHQAEDAAETMLLRLARGAGLTGLSALRPCSRHAGLKIIRPLIATTRGQILDWLRQQDLDWREDHSNRDMRIPRNRVRREILPWLEAHGMPGLRRTLARSATILRDEDDLLSQLSLAALTRCRDPRNPLVLSVDHLAREPVALQRRVIRAWLWSAGSNRAESATVERVLALATDCRGTRWIPTGAGAWVCRTYDRLAIRTQAACLTPAPYRIPVNPQPALPGVMQLPGDLRLHVWTAPWSPHAEPPRDGSPRLQVALHTAVRGANPLWLRPVRPGDRMRLSGMRGSRKLQDLWVDAKVPRDLRPRLPVLCCRGAIVWAPGMRPAPGWKARRGKLALHLRLAIEPETPPARIS